MLVKEIAFFFLVNRMTVFVFMTIVEEQLKVTSRVNHLCSWLSLPSFRTVSLLSLLADEAFHGTVEQRDYCISPEYLSNCNRVVERTNPIDENHRFHLL